MSRGARPASERPKSLVAIFPGFESAIFGGVQASGREAWRAVGSLPNVSAEALFYEPGTSRLTAAVRALALGVHPEIIVVWHIGLLKLAACVSPALLAGSGPPTVVFLHGIEAWRRHDAVTRLLMRRVTLFLTNSDHTWRRFLQFYPELAGVAHRTVHLGLGEPAAEVPAPEAPPTVLMIGRMAKDENYKGHREMIAVWPEVSRAVPGAELWIVGGGDLRPALEAQAAGLGLASQVRFFGAVPEEVKQELLGKCRVFAMPSAGEGFGLVYLEAMRMGRPSIVSRLDAGLEVVAPPEAGLAVDLTDQRQTTETVIRLLSPGAEWDGMAARARQRYNSSFTGQHFRQRLLAALEPVIGRA